MTEEHHVQTSEPCREPRREVKLDARTSTERLDSALARIERVLQEFDHRLTWD